MQHDRASRGIQHQWQITAGLHQAAGRLDAQTEERKGTRVYDIALSSETAGKDSAQGPTWDVFMCGAALWQVPGECAVQEV